MAPGRKVKATSDKDESNHKINEYLSRNEDKGAQIANISDAPKRAKTNEGDLLFMAKPTRKEIKWKRGKFQVYCCVNAFDPKEKCKLVICGACHTANELEAGVEKVAMRGKRQKRNAGTGVAKLTGGGPTKGDCTHHTRADLKNLTLETNEKYCARKRKDAPGYANIAKICYQCGITI
mmetsp:Transcript_22097/g.36183  ORF Transcript_22097/g.36183 Transcript_22097/m.36183 type:complete len:178 (+) Transcript_22097:1096-1629(+)